MLFSSMGFIRRTARDSLFLNISNSPSSASHFHNIAYFR